MEKEKEKRQTASNCKCFQRGVPIHTPCRRACGNIISRLTVCRVRPRTYVARVKKEIHTSTDFVRDINIDSRCLFGRPWLLCVPTTLGLEAYASLVHVRAQPLSV